jgi:hypothetical protein
MSDDELEAELASFAELVDDMDEEPVHEKEVQLTIEMKKGETVEQAKARAALSPEYHAANSIFQLGQILSSKDVDLTKLAKGLEYQSQRLSEGNLGQVESMLTAQAHTLDALFHNLLRRAALNVKNEFSVVERLFKLALKAQSQSRTTLDSIAAMKKPPPELIKQTNVALGHQQVNNFPKKVVGENELLEETDGERMDAGKASEAISGDQTLETVESKHRAKDT